MHALELVQMDEVYSLKIQSSQFLIYQGLFSNNQTKYQPKRKKKKKKNAFTAYLIQTYLSFGHPDD